VISVTRTAQVEVRSGGVSRPLTWYTMSIQSGSRMQRVCTGTLVHYEQTVRRSVPPLDPGAADRRGGGGCESLPHLHSYRITMQTIFRGGHWLHGRGVTVNNHTTELHQRAESASLHLNITLEVSHAPI